MLLVQPLALPPGHRISLPPLCFDYENFEQDSEVDDHCADEVLVDSRRHLESQHERGHESDQGGYYEKKEPCAYPDSNPQDERHPILSASMSAVDLGGGCLAFGHGGGRVVGGGRGGGAVMRVTPGCAGCFNANVNVDVDVDLGQGQARRGSLPLATELVEASFLTEVRGDNERKERDGEIEREPPPSPRQIQRQSTPLALFARIKKQLQLSPKSPPPVPASSEGGRELRGESMRLKVASGVRSEDDGERGTTTRELELEKKALALVRDTATAPPPSPPSIIHPVTTQPPRVSSSSSAKRNQRRRRVQKEKADKQQQQQIQLQMEEDAAFSSPSAYSCSSPSDDGDMPSSFIGSSASFLEHERREVASRDREFMLHPRARLPVPFPACSSTFDEKNAFQQDSGHGYSPTTPNNNNNKNKNANNPAQPIYNEDDDDDGATSTLSSSAQSEAESYVPYLPLIIQHERLQAKLRVPVPIDVVSGTGSVKSRSLRSTSVGSKTQSRSRSSPSLVHDNRRGDGDDGDEKKKEKEKQKKMPRSRSARRTTDDNPTGPPVMAAAPQMSPTSPTTSTSTGSPITPNTPRFFAASISKEDHRRRQSHYASDADPDTVDSKNHTRQSILVHADVNVNVLPPTPTTPTTGFGSGSGSDNRRHQSSSSSSSSPPSSPPLSPPAAAHSRMNRSRSLSRQNLGKAPPPPSGPLPLPPQSQIDGQSGKAIVEKMKIVPSSSSYNPSSEFVFPMPTSTPTRYRDETFVDTTPEMRFAFAHGSENDDMDMEEAEDIVILARFSSSSSTSTTTGTEDEEEEEEQACAHSYNNNNNNPPFQRKRKHGQGHGYHPSSASAALSESRSVVAPELRFSHHAQAQIQAHGHGQGHVQVQPPLVVVVDPPPDDDDRHPDVFALHEERMRKAAKTRKIGVGRQQVHRAVSKAMTEKGATPTGKKPLEWTLCLGVGAGDGRKETEAEAELEATTTTSSSKGVRQHLAVPPSSPPPYTPSSPATTLLSIPEVKVSSQDALPASSSPSNSSSSSRRSSSKSKPRGPSPAAQLRMRAKSESALGGRNHGGGVQDWTLMLPLPPLPTLPSSKPSSPPAKSGTANAKKGRHSDPNPGAGGSSEFANADIDADVDDTSSVANFSTDMHMCMPLDAHFSSRDDLSVSRLRVSVTDVDADAQTTTMMGKNVGKVEIEEMVLRVPRVVSSPPQGRNRSGSGTSGTAKAKSRRLSRASSLRTLVSSTPPPTEVEASFSVIAINDDHAHPADVRQRQRCRSSNLAKLDALSADLARFNEMLRGAGDGNAGTSADDDVDDAPDVDDDDDDDDGNLSHQDNRTTFIHSSLSTDSGTAVVFSTGGAKRRGSGGGARLKLARSHGIFEVDEPPPPHAVLRVPSVGDLLLGVGRVKEKEREKEAVVLAMEGLSATTTEDSAATPRISIESTTSSSSSTFSTMSNPFDYDTPTPATPTSPSHTLVAPPTRPPPAARMSVQSFASMASINSACSSKASSSTLAGTLSTSPTSPKIRAPLPFAPPSPPSAFGSYAVGRSRSVGSGNGVNAAHMGRTLSTAGVASSSLCPRVNVKGTVNTGTDERGAVNGSVPSGSLRTGTGLEGRGRAGSLRVVTTAPMPKRADVVVVVEREENGEGTKFYEEIDEVEATKARATSSVVSTSLTSSSPGTTLTQTETQTFSKNTPALRVETSSLSLLSFPSNSTLRPSTDRDRRTSFSSSKSSHSSGSLTPTTASHSKHTRMSFGHGPNLSALPDYYYSPSESESAAPTPLASSFPVPPTFPLLPSSSVSMMKPTTTNEEGVGTPGNVGKYPTPGTADSTSTSTVTPMHIRCLSLEERVRQLRVLGVDPAAAVWGEGLVAEKTKQENKAAAAVGVEKESDEESWCSDSFYSARSSFSSERSGAGEL